MPSKMKESRLKSCNSNPVVVSWEGGGAMAPHDWDEYFEQGGDCLNRMI
jgi:hypothetical protein